MIRVKRVLGVFLLAIGAMACSKAQSQIPAKASGELKCPADQIKVRSRRQTSVQSINSELADIPEHYFAQGCGRAALFAKICRLKAGKRDCTFHSVRKLRRQALLKRAAFDLECGPNQLELTWLDKRTTGVTGCGSKVTYLLNCPHQPDLWSPSCTWVLNTDALMQTRKNAESPPAGPPAPAAPAPPAAAPPAPTPAAPSPPVEEAPPTE